MQTTATAAAAQHTTQRSLLGNYTQTQLDALLQLFSVAKRHIGCSGGNTAARVLLGLYNGTRFPFDLTDLRLLDDRNLTAALVAIEMDARRTHAEVHDVLNDLLGVRWVGSQLELWAYDLRLTKRCKKVALPHLQAHIAGGAA
jgi:hypothetical protein